MEAVSDNSFYAPLSCTLLTLCLLLTKSMHGILHSVLKMKAVLFHKNSITSDQNHAIQKAPPYILA